MRLSEIMSKPVHSIPPDVELDKARREMTAHHVEHLIVVEGEAIVGVISNHDLVRTRGALYDDKWYVEDIMSEPPITASPDTTTAEAAAMMRGSNIGCLPVVEDNRIVGIVTTADLLGLLARGAS